METVISDNEGKLMSRGVSTRRRPGAAKRESRFQRRCTFLSNDLGNVFLAFRKGLVRHEAVAALVNGHVVVTGLTCDRVITD